MRSLKKKQYWCYAFCSKMMRKQRLSGQPPSLSALTVGLDWSYELKLLYSLLLFLLPTGRGPSMQWRQLRMPDPPSKSETKLVNSSYLASILSSNVYLSYLFRVNYPFQQRAYLLILLGDLSFFLLVSKGKAMHQAGVIPEKRATNVLQCAVH